MDIVYRDFVEADYDACESLVAQAWKIDEILGSPRLAALGKRLYTRGSLLESNFNSVALADDKVVGFLFGRNEFIAKPRGRFGFGLSFLWWLISFRAPGKRTLLRALGTHEKNRAPILSNQSSEVVLFVIAPAFQRRGIGRQLWLRFRTHCEHGGVTEIFVEANRTDASGYYAGLGFEHVQDFDSPLHGLFSEDAVASIYRWRPG